MPPQLSSEQQSSSSNNEESSPLLNNTYGSSSSSNSNANKRCSSNNGIEDNNNSSSSRTSKRSDSVEEGGMKTSFQYQKQFTTSSSSFSEDLPKTFLGPSSWMHLLSQKTLIVLASVFVVLLVNHLYDSIFSSSPSTRIGIGEDLHIVAPIGPYRLIEAQEGKKFFDSYDFYDGADSLGSAGYNVYVGKERAEELGIVGVKLEEGVDGMEEELVYMSSAAAAESASITTSPVSPDDANGNGAIGGMRESIRLEGKMRFDRGLFILDVRHMPDGCGVWPAFWLTDEDAWPKNGEVDILEGVNGQTVAKTALHTSDQCDMYAHVPPFAKTGDWEWVTGIPETYTGEPDFATAKAADNCWVMAQHQWQNEGCTAVHDQNNTLGKPVNDAGGGVYVLEWDPENGCIKSWVFTHAAAAAGDIGGGMPVNLVEATNTASDPSPRERVAPDPSTWGLPYAYFAIGEATGCSASHFRNMRIVFNLAFCGNVAGNRFAGECPSLYEKFSKAKGVEGDIVKSCNAYIGSNPEELEEAYWKIRGVYVYEREMRRVPKKKQEG